MFELRIFLISSYLRVFIIYSLSIQLATRGAWFGERVGGRGSLEPKGEMHNLVKGDSLEDMSRWVYNSTETLQSGKMIKKLVIINFI